MELLKFDHPQGQVPPSLHGGKGEWMNLEGWGLLGFFVVVEISSKSLVVWLFCWDLGTFDWFISVRFCFFGVFLCCSEPGKNPR